LLYLITSIAVVVTIITLVNYKVVTQHLEADIKAFKKQNSWSINEITRVQELLTESRRETIQQATELRDEKHKAILEARVDAAKRSKRVNRGFTLEHFAPKMIPGLNPADYRHIGDPIDYLVISGSSDLSNGSQDQIDSVILLDIKTGRSQLSKVQRRIRDAVVAGRVAFCVFNPDLEPEKQFRTWEQPDE